MNSKIATLSAIVSLVLVTLTLLNLNAIPTAAFPRTRVGSEPEVVDLEEYLRDQYYDDIDQKSSSSSTNRLPEVLDAVEDLLPLDDIDRNRLLRTRLSRPPFPLSSSSGRSRQMDKRHICEYHGVCEQCAKHTKSHEVYSQCCRNVEGRKWCTDFMNYQMGRK